MLSYQSRNSKNEFEIRYKSLTADVNAKSDEGFDCVNTVEIAYFCLMGLVLLLGCVSFIRLSKVFKLFFEAEKNADKKTGNDHES